ncbi:MAG: TIGR04211 family SH3 domain-containing protein [Gammaproteobacteria bacterium]|nr:TIGR04211 family SH3 domain-containing protein [Gammaproteobacteria bacterium]
MTLIAPRSVLALSIVLLTAICVGFLPSQASAAPRWVNDEIPITFRSGPGTEFRILRYLTTGARLETATPPEGRFPASSMEGWTFLQDSAGEQGWIQDQYLAQQPPARIRIEAVQNERDSARERVAALTAELAASQSEKADLNQQLETNETQIRELQANFAAARQGFELVETNQALERTIEDLRASNAALEIEKQTIGDRNLKEWFLIGAGVLAAGLIMGLILPSLRRKPDPWGSSRL